LPKGQKEKLKVKSESRCEACFAGRGNLVRYVLDCFAPLAMTRVGSACKMKKGKE